MPEAAIVNQLNSVNAHDPLPRVGRARGVARPRIDIHSLNAMSKSAGGRKLAKNAGPGSDRLRGLL